MQPLSDHDIQQAAERVLGALRSADGLDEEAVQELKGALRSAALEWKSSEVVPKSAANLFVDLAPAIEACGDLYPGLEGERIAVVAGEISDLIREVLRID